MINFQVTIIVLLHGYLGVRIVYGSDGGLHFISIYYYREKFSRGHLCQLALQNNDYEGKGEDAKHFVELNR